MWSCCEVEEEVFCHYDFHVSCISLICLFIYVYVSVSVYVPLWSLSCSLQSPSQGLTQLTESPKITIEEEFLELTPRNTVDGLKRSREVSRLFYKVFNLFFLCNLITYILSYYWHCVGCNTTLSWYQQAIYVVFATVVDVVAGMPWWYTACLCSKAVFPDSNLYFCEKCYKHVMKVTPR